MTETPTPVETDVIAAIPEWDALRTQLEVKAPGEMVDWINALIYGDPGVGKTYLMGTADDSELTGPLLALDVEGGMTTLRSRQGIDVVTVRSMQDAVDVYNSLYKSIKDGKLPYKTIGIDSLTELADIDLKEIMLKEHNAKPDKIEKDVATQSGWGKTRTHIRNLVRAYRDLPCNVIFIASAGIEREEGHPTKLFPGFAGKLRTEIPGFVDIVGHYSAEVNPVTKEVIRKLQVQGTNRVVAKDRTGVLGGLVVNPTIPMMWDMIHNLSPQTNIQADAA